MIDDNRFRDVERRLYDIEKKLATGDITSQNTNDKLKELMDELKTLKAGINKVLWALGTVALAAVGNFILKGGLVIGGTG